MYKKIFIFLFMFVFGIGLLKPDIVKANEDTLYSSFEEYLLDLGLKLPEFEVKSDKVYLFYKTERSYKSSGVCYEIIEIDRYSNKYRKTYMTTGSTGATKLNCPNNASGSTNYSVKVDDYGNIGTSWSSSDTGTNPYMAKNNGAVTLLYSDFCIYDSKACNEVVYWANGRKYPPSIPYAIVDGAETFIMGVYSPMTKNYAGDYFLIVGNGNPLLRWGDRALVLEDNGEYVQYELWQVNQDNEWFISQHYINVGVANDIEGFDIEYSPQIIYTNKPIYNQKEDTTDLVSGSLYCDIKLPNNTPENDTEELPPVDKSLKLQEVTKTGFKYNGVSYEWGVMDTVIDINNLEDYIVFYDDLEKKLYFVWANDDSLMAQANYQMMNSNNVSFHFDIYTKKTNSSATDFYWCEYKINSNGYLDEINALQNGTVDYDTLRLDLGWSNPDYTIQDETTEGDAKKILPEYQNYVLQNNIVVSTCDIFNYSGVQIFSKTNGIINDNIKPDEIPDDLFGAIKYYLYEKLPIIQTTEVFIYKFKNVLQTMEDTDKAPEIIMKVNDFYGYTGELNVLDLSWYEPYRQYVKAIISALLIAPFILWVYRKGLPDAIGGI